MYSDFRNNFIEEISSPISPNFWPNDVIFDSEMAKFWQFWQKMTYFEENEPINDIFNQIKVHKPERNNF